MPIVLNCWINCSISWLQIEFARDSVWCKYPADTFPAKLYVGNMVRTYITVIFKRLDFPANKWQFLMFIEGYEVLGVRRTLSPAFVSVLDSSVLQVCQACGLTLGALRSSVTLCWCELNPSETHIQGISSTDATQRCKGRVAGRDRNRRDISERSVSLPPTTTRHERRPPMALCCPTLGGYRWQKMASSPLVRRLFHLKCQSNTRNTGSCSEWGGGGLPRYFLRHRRV